MAFQPIANGINLPQRRRQCRLCRRAVIGGRLQPQGVMVNRHQHRIQPGAVDRGIGVNRRLHMLAIIGSHNFNGKAMPRAGANNRRNDKAGGPRRDQPQPERHQRPRRNPSHRLPDQIGHPPQLPGIERKLRQPPQPGPQTLRITATQSLDPVRKIIGSTHQPAKVGIEFGHLELLS